MQPRLILIVVKELQRHFGGNPRRVNPIQGQTLINNASNTWGLIQIGKALVELITEGDRVVKPFDQDFEVVNLIERASYDRSFDAVYVVKVGRIEFEKHLCLLAFESLKSPSVHLDQLTRHIPVVSLVPLAQG